MPCHFLLLCFRYMLAVAYRLCTYLTVSAAAPAHLMHIYAPTCHHAGSHAVSPVYGHALPELLANSQPMQNISCPAGEFVTDVWLWAWVDSIPFGIAATCSGSGLLQPLSFQPGVHPDNITGDLTGVVGLEVRKRHFASCAEGMDATFMQDNGGAAIPQAVVPVRCWRARLMRHIFLLPMTEAGPMMYAPIKRQPFYCPPGSLITGLSAGFGAWEWAVHAGNDTSSRRRAQLPALNRLAFSCSPINKPALPTVPPDGLPPGEAMHTAQLGLHACIPACRLGSWVHAAMNELAHPLVTHRRNADTCVGQVRLASSAWLPSAVLALPAWWVAYDVEVPCDILILCFSKESRSSFLGTLLRIQPCASHCLLQASSSPACMGCTAA